MAPAPSYTWSIFVVAEDTIDTHCSSVGWRSHLPPIHALLRPHSPPEHEGMGAKQQATSGPVGPPGHQKITRRGAQTQAEGPAAAVVFTRRSLPLVRSTCLSSRSHPDKRTSRAAAGDQCGTPVAPCTTLSVTTTESDSLSLSLFYWLLHTTNPETAATLYTRSGSALIFSSGMKGALFAYIHGQTRGIMQRLTARCSVSQ